MKAYLDKLIELASEASVIASEALTPSTATLVTCLALLLLG
jgi:hypothetical protein